MRKYITTPAGRKIPAPKPQFIGKTWTLEADFGEARGMHDGRVHGYATRADTVATHGFVIVGPGKPRAMQLYSHASEARAPMYIRQAVGRMMRTLERRAAK